MSAVSHASAADVSVVVPCYRSRETVGRAIMSVANQTVRPRELIAVDDCSGDGTLEELYRLQATFPEGWMQVIALARNSGPATARNAAMDGARQPYIAFLDADDSWHPEKVAQQWSWMRERPEVALTCHGLPLFDGELHDSGVGGVEFNRIGRAGLLLSNVVFTPTVMMRRDPRHRFPEGQRYSEDYLLWLTICLSGGVCERAVAPLAFRYKHTYGDGGLSGQLWAMELNELKNYWVLLRQGLIGMHEMAFFGCVSMLKFVRRATILWLRKVRR